MHAKVSLKNVSHANVCSKNVSHAKVCLKDVCLSYVCLKNVSHVKVCLKNVSQVERLKLIFVWKMSLMQMSVLKCFYLVGNPDNHQKFVWKTSFMQIFVWKNSHVKICLNNVSQANVCLKKVPQISCKCFYNRVRLTSENCHKYCVDVMHLFVWHLTRYSILV